MIRTKIDSPRRGKCVGSLSKDCDEEEGKNNPDTQFSSFASISVHHVDSGVSAPFGNLLAWNGAGKGKGRFSTNFRRRTRHLSDVVVSFPLSRASHLVIRWCEVRQKNESR